jgi:hypothetical protein
MDVFGRGTGEPSRPLLNPGICFICENSPSQEEIKVIDTRREFNPNCLTKLSGRKYVCESCATEMGQAVGMVSRDEHLDTVAEVEDLESSLGRVNARLDEAVSSQHRVVSFDELKPGIESIVSETVRTELAKKVPARKPVTKSEASA